MVSIAKWCSREKLEDTNIFVKTIERVNTNSKCSFFHEDLIKQILSMVKKSLLNLCRKKKVQQSCKQSELGRTGYCGVFSQVQV